MNIVHCLDAQHMYGSAAMVRELAGAQQAEGHNVSVACLLPDAIAEPSAVEAALTQANIPVFRVSLNSRPTFAQWRAARRKIQQQAADVCQSHSYKASLLLALGQRLAIAHVATLHGQTNSAQNRLLAFYYWLERKLLKRFDAVCCVSEASAAQLGAGFHHPFLSIVANGLNAEVNAESFPRDARGDHIVIGSLGRLSREKHFSLLLQAFARLHEKHPKLRLQIAGDGPLKNVLQKEAAELGLTNSVSLPGFIEDTSRFLNKVNVYVNCSLSEGMPMSLLEVMRLGRPIVVSDIPANTKLIHNSELGFTFPSGDPGALAQALEAALSMSDAEASHMMQAQREEFSRDYSALAMCERYEAIYKRALQSRG